MTQKETNQARQAAAAGVLAATAVAVWACFDSMRAMTLLVLVALAAKYIILAAGACATAYALFSRLKPLCLRHHLFGSLMIAVWMPALALCIDSSSRWVLAPAVVIAIVWTVASRSHNAANSLPKTHTHQQSAPILTAPDLMARSPNAGHTFSASMLFQSTLGLAFAGEPVSAVAPAGIASALLAARCYPTGAKPVESCTSLRHCGAIAAILTVAATSVTGAALSRHLTRGGLYPGGTEDLAPLFLPRDRPTAGVVDDDVHMGVIILPEIQPKITLVPPLPSLAPGFGQTQKPDPLSIPFFGAYWIYRPPHTRPPPKSLVLRGTPVDRRLRSTDRVRLKMEARQNLGSFFPIACCRAVEVVVKNRDTYENTITVETVLGDTAAVPKDAWQSLGKTPLPSFRSTFRGPILESQRLAFPIPATAHLKKFDEIVVIFHLDPFRAHRAAQVAIERFVLVPRGGGP